jgi:hypothetical protein
VQTVAQAQSSLESKQKEVDALRANMNRLDTQLALLQNEQQVTASRERVAFPWLLLLVHLVRVVQNLEQRREGHQQERNDHEAAMQRNQE